MKIGIGITTQNRYEIFCKTLAEIHRLAPEGAKIVVVDDASADPVSEADFRFDNCVGIARAKNKCFELLDDCDHIFLFDDDTYPITEGWWLPYVKSPEPHLMYMFDEFSNGRKLNDNVTIYTDSAIVGCSHPRGCMLYFNRVCLDVVGGMDPFYGRWGWEHPDISRRIFNAGLTTFRFADIPGSKELFYSGDEHSAVPSTVYGRERQNQIMRNKLYYEQQKESARYIPYKTELSKGKDILITTFFTGVSDCQQGKKWEADHSLLDTLIASLRDNKLVVLNDCFDLPDTQNVEYRKVETNITPYFQRWLSIYQYLLRNKDIGNVFCIDGTDVEVLKNPFNEDLRDCLYIGDEKEILGCPWMRRHFPASMLQQFISRNANNTLLNAGIVGGNRLVVLNFIKEVLAIYYDNKADVAARKSASVGDIDMGVLNYVAYNKFADRLVHGRQVNTIFKAFEKNDVSWFRHK